ncbi:hypothetical protein ISN44_As05g016580 [Arabidopsis suecica]|uniref:Uncharacterized protein n=1 Tax=Arabidopsis suecica TaxID=45249 RepID=A0A8T2DGI5_ARASU|nr:hypothetical protein ISN44_As05g016580 [Arabidopsis suecica]
MGTVSLILKSSVDDKKKVLYRRGMTTSLAVTHERIVFLPNTCTVLTNFSFRFIEKFPEPLWTNSTFLLFFY